VNISPGMSLSRCHKNASESDLAVVWEDLEMHDAVCAAASGFIATIGNAGAAFAGLFETKDGAVRECSGPFVGLGPALNQSTSILLRQGYFDPSYVFANLTDVSVSFYPLAMDFVPPRDLNSSAVLEVRVCTKDMISGQPEPVK